MTARWSVEPSGRHAVTVTGPALADLVRYIAQAIADASSPEDQLHERWDGFVTARRNVVAAAEYGVEDVGAEQLEDAAADAWDALVPDLPESVRLPHAEARLLAQLLDENAGRVGAVRT